MGPLADIIQPGPSGSWTVTSGEKGVQLINRQSPGDLRYYFVNEKPDHQANRTVTVTTQLLETGPNALAGLLYGYQDNPRSYFLFSVGGNGMVNLHYRGDNGFEQRMQSSLQGSPEQPVTLKIVEQGNEISLFVNDRNIGSLGNDRMGRGSLGIAAADTGVFRFSQFSIGD